MYRGGEEKENEIFQNHSKVHLCHPRQISCKGDHPGSGEQKGTSWNNHRRTNGSDLCWSPKKKGQHRTKIPKDFQKSDLPVPFSKKKKNPNSEEPSYISSQSPKKPTQPQPSHTPSPSLTPTSPSLCSVRLHSEKREKSSTKKKKQKKHRPKSAKPKGQISAELVRESLCAIGAVEDFQLWKTLKPLLKLETVHDKQASKPSNFKGATMVTTFVHSASSHTGQVWRFLERASQADSDVWLAEFKHSTLWKISNFCLGRVPICFHPYLYRSLKVKFTLDVGGLSRDVSDDWARYWLRDKLSASLHRRISRPL